MNYMIDLETLGVTVDAAIMQIVLVAFDDEKIVRGHKWEIYPPKGHIDIETVKWWFDQIKEGAPNPLIQKNPTPIEDALIDMTSRMKEIDSVWSNPSTFDVVITELAYYQSGMIPPWTFHQVRDVKTLADFFPDAERPKPEDAHDALSDAMAQAQWVLNIFKQHREDRKFIENPQDYM